MRKSGNVLCFMNVQRRDVLKNTHDKVQHFFFLKKTPLLYNFQKEATVSGNKLGMLASVRQSILTLQSGGINRYCAVSVDCVD